MSYPAKPRINRGAYASPFSGVGMEFYPLGLTPGLSGVILHEAGYLAKNRAWNFPAVFGSYWRLLYDWRRGHRIRLPGCEVRLGPEKLVLYPDHFRSDFEGDAEVPSSWLHFSFERRPAAFQELPIELPPRKAELLVMEELAGLFGRDEEKNRPRIYALSQALLQMTLSRPEIHWLEREPEAVRRAVQIIQARFAEPLYMSEVARQAGLSVRGLNRAFAYYRGVPPTQFIAQVRIREAAHLLATTSLNVEEIAARSGFPSGAYLCLLFKRFTGTTTSAFRRNHAAWIKAQTQHQAITLDA